jgi:hypothetical protein
MLSALGRPGPAPPAFKPDCSGAGLATFPDSSSVGGPGGGGPGAGPGSAPRLWIGHVYRHASATRHRRFRLALGASGGKAPGVRVTLRTARGKLLARSGEMTVSRRRTVTLRLKRALPRGEYTLNARGRHVSKTRRIVLR